VRETQILVAQVPPQGVLVSRKVDVRLPGKREVKLQWREAGPPNHHDDKVDSDLEVVNKELSMCGRKSAVPTLAAVIDMPLCDPLED